MKRDLTEEQLNQAVTLTLPLRAVLRLAGIDAASPVAAAPHASIPNLPAIGQPYLGGIYAGITVQDDVPAVLVLLPGDERKTWSDAVTWAESQGGRLPSRIDQLVLFKNLKSEFKGEYYWSGEQYAGNDSSAWFQYFSLGGQDYGRKGYGCRCRAVRSIPIR